MRAALEPLMDGDARRGPGSSDAERPKALNVLGLLAHHPELTRAYNTFNGHILYATTLMPRQRELVVLRVSALRDAVYEWAQHVVLGLEAGLTAAEIDRIVEGHTATGWSSLDRAMLRAVDELVAEADVGDETWAVLAGELTVDQLLDLVFTVGAYDLMAMVMRAFRVELDEDLRRWAPPA